MNYGFVKVAAAVPKMKIADCEFNEFEIQTIITKAEGQHIEVICFPELCITGYTCGDLFGQQLLLDRCEEALFKLLEATRTFNIIAIVGAPLLYQSTLLNTAIVIQHGKILGIVPKTFIPNYKEFYEQRWFASSLTFPETQVHLCGQLVPLSARMLFHTSQMTFGIEICEDLWAPIPPSNRLALEGAEVMFNLSATNECIGKNAYLRTLISQQSARLLCGYVYASCGFGESTQDLVFAGNALIYENGHLIAEGKRFVMDEQIVVSEIDVERLRAERQTNTTFSAAIRLNTGTGCRHIDCQTVVPEDFTLTRSINPHPFVPAGKELDERCEEIFSIQVEGLAKRVVHTRAKTLVIGISGGLDSTLALLVSVLTVDRLQRGRQDIIGVTMPGFGTTDRTYHNAIALMRSLGITTREVSIREACLLHFRDIGHDPDVHDVTYENSQARERTQILMDIANQTDGFVVGTGDISELALGWCTYNADHMSNYGVNGSVPKTLVRHLVKWVALNHVDEQSKATLLDIVDTPISPELIPADADGNIVQKTEDLVGPYELHDFFLYYFLRFGFRPSKIFFLAQEAFSGKTPGAGIYNDDIIKKWLTTFCRRFFTQQFKRSCLPDGPKVGSVALSPRGDWRMPSDASYALWVGECENL